MAILAAEAVAIAEAERCSLDEAKSLLLEGLQASEYEANAEIVEIKKNGVTHALDSWINPEYWQIGRYDWDRDVLTRDISKSLPPKKKSSWILDTRTGQYYERNEFIRAERIDIRDRDYGSAKLHDRMTAKSRAAERAPLLAAEEIARQEQQSPHMPSPPRKRRKPQRPPGLSYEKMDEPFLQAMRSLLEARKVVTATKAAEHVIDAATRSGSPVFGSGTRASKISRLVKAYKVRSERAA